MKKDDCIFCKIVSGEVKSDILYEDEHVIIINDAKPVVPIHLLVIPKLHTEDVREYINNPETLGNIVNAANIYAKEKEFDSFRLINNCGENAGQSVMHTHFHILKDDSLKNVFI